MIGEQAPAIINFYMDLHNWNAESLNEGNRDDWDDLIIEFIRYLHDRATFMDDMSKKIHEVSE